MPVLAGDLTGVRFDRQGRDIIVTLATDADQTVQITTRPDGLVTVLDLAAIERLPPLPILEVGDSGLAAALLERGPGGKGARITLMAPEAVAIMAEPPAPNGLAFRLHPLSAKPEPAKPAAVPVAKAPPVKPKSEPAPIAPKPSAPPKPVETALPQEAKPPKSLKADDPIVKAALRGDQGAQVELGTLCLKDKPPDPTAARKWFELAGRNGNTVAAFNLAQLLRNGLGGPMDEAGAIKYYRIAAEQGLAQAQYNLALMLLKDRPGNDEAQRWLKSAADQNYAQAITAMKDLGQK
jgi:outer membrane biosynthesis protein TonB